MAITKAQQARQMLIKGGVVHSDGRRGFFTGAERDARAGRGDISPGTDRQGNQRDNNPRRGGAGPFSKPTSTKPKAPPGRPEVGPFKPSTKPKDKPDIIKPKPKPPKKTDFRDLFRGIFPTTTSVVNAINQSGIVRNLNAAQRQAYLDSLDLTDEDDKEEYDRIMNQLGGLGMDIIAGPTDLKNTKLSAPIAHHLLIRLFYLWVI